MSTASEASNVSAMKDGMLPDLGEEREGMRQYYDYSLFFMDCGSNAKNIQGQTPFMPPAPDRKKPRQRNHYTAF